MLSIPVGSFFEQEGRADSGLRGGGFGVASGSCQERPAEDPQEGDGGLRFSPWEKEEPTWGRTREEEPGSTGVDSEEPRAHTTLLGKHQRQRPSSSAERAPHRQNWISRWKSSSRAPSPPDRKGTRAPVRPARLALRGQEGAE